MQKSHVTPTPRPESDIEKAYDARIARGEFIHDEECRRFGTEEHKIARGLIEKPEDEAVQAEDLTP